MSVTAIKIGRCLRRAPREAIRLFVDPVFNSGQALTFLISVIGLFIILSKGNYETKKSQIDSWIISIESFSIVCIFWILICLFRAPFVVSRRDRENGKWQSHHYIYNQPRLIASERFIHNDGRTQTRAIDFKDVEPHSFVYYRIEAQPNAIGRIQTFINGGPPIAQFELAPPQVGVIRSMQSAPGAYVGIRLPKNRNATLHVRIKEATVPIILRIYCNEFYVGKED